MPASEHCWLRAALGLGALLCGCESAEEKCAAARGRAEEAWSSYVSSLEAAIEDAKELDRNGKDKLRAIERRLAEPVEVDVDGRYERASGAWMRAFESGLHKACMANDECSDLKQRLARAADTLEDFGERIEPARKARDSAQLDIHSAKQAADEVEIHAEYPVVKAAQKATAEMVEVCRDVPPPKPPEGS